MDGPTAIVPARAGSLAERFDRLSRAFGDPLATLFMTMRATEDEENRIRCASELLPYRYPKLRAQDTTLRAGEGASVSIQINIGAPPAAADQTIDVTPEAPAEEIDPLS